MKRHYFVSDDLDDLAHTERELEGAGVSKPQIHVLSEDDAGVAIHHLHTVEAVLKKDVVHGTQLGALCGAIGAILVVGLAWATGFAETYTWVPAIFFAIIVLGFCTWEGGLIGIQQPHSQFRRFQELLKQGKHILLIDVEPQQEAALATIVNKHPGLRAAGEGNATPKWVIRSQQLWTNFVHAAP